VAGDGRVVRAWPRPTVSPLAGPCARRSEESHDQATAMTASTPAVDPSVPPSGPGCAACTDGDGPGWWFHLRRCAQCGAVGCCDSSPSQHATRHARTAGHPVLRSFEPGEDWFWDVANDTYLDGPELAPPQARPDDQPVPGPAGRVPADWREHLR